MAKAVVSTKKESTVPAELEKQFEAFEMGGFENADIDSYAVPFLRILQGLSPQVNEDDSDVYIEGAKPGMFYNTVSSKVYGKEIEVIPVTFYREFIEWAPNRGGFVRAHGPNPAILEQCVRNDRNQDVLPNGNVVQDTRCHIVLLANEIEAGPMLFPLVSTGIRHSKKWMSLMRMMRTPGGKSCPMFSCRWKLWTVLNKNDDGSWYMIGDRSLHAVEYVGWVNAQQWSAAIEAKKLFDAGRTKVDYSSGLEPGSSDENTPF
ncbi:MAG: hypothetical protein M0P18_10335 [Syntrophales bacterium]|nr:hypothetical protein [Syntrophales bacterium]